MKIKEGYILRDILDTSVVVPVGERVVDFKGIMTLKGVAPFLWRMLEQGATRDELLAAVTQEYEVDEATAAQDIDNLLAEMRQLGLLVE